MVVRTNGIASQCVDAEINGLIVNQTRTLIGSEFYRHFCTLWGEPKVDYQYNITIMEIPDARWGSLMTIEVNGKIAYRKSIRPRSDKAKEEASHSIPQIRKFLMYLISTNGKNSSEDLQDEGY